MRSINPLLLRSTYQNPLIGILTNSKDLLLNLRSSTDAIELKLVYEYNKVLYIGTLFKDNAIA